MTNPESRKHNKHKHQQENDMNTFFAKPGPTNSRAALDVLRQGASRLGVKEVIVASTYGDTGLAAATAFANSEVRVIVVTHNVGFKEPGTLEMTAETRKKIEDLGARVHTGTMPFRTIGTAIREKQAYSQQDLVANTLRLFGQGMKVCVEIVIMAADSGLIGTNDVLAMAGTGRGADTVALIAPQSSNNLFSLKIRDILVKPVDW